MKFFINSGLFSRGGETYKVQFLENNEIKLSIPYYLSSEKKHKYINFIFSGTNDSIKNRFKNPYDIMFQCSSFKQTGKDTYRINVSNSNVPVRNYGLYALIKSDTVVPDDVFVPKSVKENLKVIRMIEYVDCEPDYGNFLTKIYLIKVKLNPEEGFPLYLTSAHPKFLDKHLVIHRANFLDKDYYARANLETYIYLRENDNGYISLSKLYNNNNEN